MLASLGQLLEPSTFASLLWIGVGVLTVSLLVLSRTQWGQARPLSKCIALSVYAHVLLGGYAYVTNLFLPPPPAPRPSAIRLAYLEAAADSRLSRPARELPDPWDEPSGSLWEGPRHVEPERLEAAPTHVAELDWAASAPANALTPAALDLPPLPDRQGLLLPDAAPPDAPPLLAEHVAPAAAAELSLQPAPTRDPVAQQAPQPTTTAPERMEPPRASVDPLAALAAPEPLADAQRDQTQQLAEALLEAAQAEAQRAAEDRLERSAADEASAAVGGAEQSGPAALSAFAALAQTAAAVAPRRLADGALMPAPYRHRHGELKRQALLQLGGNERTEAAVAAALAWLAAHQELDGRWDASVHGAGREDRVLGHDRAGAGADADTGISALALLAFLGAGHTHLEGEYRQTVQHGLEFLLAQQAANGSLAGSARLYAQIYCHGMASLALSEAYAMTGDERLRDGVESAVRFTLAAQHPGSGGWRYQPGDLGDLSQFGWQLMALRSAEQAGLELPSVTRPRMERFLRSVAKGRHGGLAAYRPQEQPSPPMTAEALACRWLLADVENPAALDEAAEYLLASPPGVGPANYYYWYYGTLGMFPRQDAHWRTWNAALQEQLLRRQRTDGALAGSWDPNTVWGGYGGRCYTTAMGALCLEVYYRYLPVFDAAADHPPQR